MTNSGTTNFFSYKDSTYKPMDLGNNFKKIVQSLEYFFKNISICIAYKK